LTLTTINTNNITNCKPRLRLNKDIFRQLLQPCDLSCFRSQHYDPKQPLVIKKGATYFDPLLEEMMEGGDILSLLEATPSETISVWTTPPAARSTDTDTHTETDKKIDTARVSDAKSAHILWKAGHSIYCRAPEGVEKLLVDSAIRGLGLGFKTETETHTHAQMAWGGGVKAVIEGEVELFLSHPGHKTPFHFDFQENISLQLQGRKKWRLIKGVNNPVRGCAPHYKQAEGVLDPAAEEQMKVHRLRDPGFRYGTPAVGEGGMCVFV
jgi:hypothetical protein